MEMNLALEISAVDLVRIGYIAIYAIGVALMLVTNVIAFMVLRPPKRLGFLWWHVSAISISFLCFGTVVLERTIRRLEGDPPVAADWRTYATALGVLTFTTAQVIIFSVERGRLAEAKAVVNVSEAMASPQVDEQGEPKDCA